MSDSIHARSLAVENLVRTGNYERALRLIHATVETIITEPICTSQVYDSVRLDGLTQEIGIQLLGDSMSGRSTTDPVPTYLYLATKLQRSGGHTRLVRDFIFARPEARHIILLTGLAGKSDSAWLAETFADITDYTCICAPRGGYVAIVRWLQTQLLQYSPDHTYLFNHHEDVTIIAAMVPALNLAASFCHHGDHHMTLGMHLPHVMHLDFHPTGFHRCRDTLGIANRYIPFTVPAEPTHGDTGFIANGMLTTCTAARKNKVETSYPVRYTQVIPALLAATGGTHIHIGSLSRKGLAAIVKGMKVRSIPAERFVYIPWVQSIREVLLEKHVDLYLSSFPLGGGLTMVEVMSAGIPIAVHKHMLTRELGGLDIVYESAFLWRKVSELTGYLARLTAVDLQKQSKDARTHYLRYYAQPLRSMLENPAHEAPPLTGKFTPEQDEWGLWVAGQMSIQHVAQRFAYRCYRQLRRWAVRARFV